MDSHYKKQEMQEKKFFFGTKAETLERIRPHLVSAIIPSQYFFSVDEWLNNREQILRKIIDLFRDNLIAVRSSALNEDTAESSMAGKYSSLLNINGKDAHKIIDAIEVVINSYTKRREYNIKNQVLIQPMIKQVTASGVIFTKVIDTGAPYFIINYDDSSSLTDTVTSGKASNLKTFTYLKDLLFLPSEALLRNLINLARELEFITDYDALDIEFASSLNNIYVLQVRPIAKLKSKICISKEKIKDTIESVKGFIRANDRKFPNLYGYKAIFGNMPDWNPAEIIGESPKPLAFSLYRELITDYIWPLSRKQLGYKDVGYQPGVVSLGGKPYVDVRLSFNTFIPASLSETTSEKLVNFYIDKLINNPCLHDKIEFKVAYTCAKFGFENEENELRQNNFSTLQNKEIRKALLKLTDDIVTERAASIDDELSKSLVLEANRKKIVESSIDTDVKISQLIYDCKYFGTLPFSKLARFAFIANILISSLVESKVITNEDRSRLLQSINSVATEFLRKLNMLKKKEISREEFIREFGHLRPGTYDLCSKTYDEAFSEYFDLERMPETVLKELHFELDTEMEEKINKAISREGFSFTAKQMIAFTKKAIAAREKSKFEFTKNLSLILNLCHEYLKKYNFSKEEVTMLEINDIVSFSHRSKPINEIENLRDKISKNGRYYEITKSLRLPPLIYMEKNADYFHQFDEMPNFITSKNVVGEVINLDNINDFSELNDKIVMIANADPGYDWVFGHNIKGLITKYGGIASHMSIRCAEFNLAAAIGCGETIFNHLKNFNKIELNCSANSIKGVY